MAEQDRVAVRLVYDAGARARAEGKTHLENPHPIGSGDHLTWMLGWQGRPHPAVEVRRG